MGKEKLKETTEIIWFPHHGEEVACMLGMDGKHRDFCLCHKCDLLNMEDREKNCKTASLLFALDIKCGVTTPVFYCKDFVSRPIHKDEYEEALEMEKVAKKVTHNHLAKLLDDVREENAYNEKVRSNNETASESGFTEIMAYENKALIALITYVSGILKDSE